MQCTDEKFTRYGNERPRYSSLTLVDVSTLIKISFLAKVFVFLNIEVRDTCKMEKKYQKIKYVYVDTHIREAFRKLNCFIIEYYLKN